MAETRIHPVLKLVLEIGPIAVFFLAYRLGGAPEGVSREEAELSRVLFATAVFVPTVLASLAASWLLARHLPRMAVLTAVVVVIFGGLTLALRDDTFIKMKPTILYALFAGVLGIGLARGTSYLEYLMGEMLPLDHAGWMKFTARFALFFAAVAVLNEIVWRSVSTDTWVNFRTFVLPLCTFGFILSQTPMLQRHSTEGDQG
ncbi:MAG: septation protein A [Pseudomonadota bacterium]